MKLSLNKRSPHKLWIFVGRTIVWNLYDAAIILDVVNRVLFKSYLPPPHVFCMRNAHPSECNVITH